MVLMITASDTLSKGKEPWYSDVNSNALIQRQVVTVAPPCDVVYA
jgi:hypothetical protein